jgi:hypothetical protein
MWFRKVIALALATVFLAGCWVTTDDFDEYKARIKADGDAVEAWIAGANPWFIWMTQNIDAWCQGQGCSPPSPPPQPPPVGEWE